MKSNLGNRSAFAQPNKNNEQESSHDIMTSNSITPAKIVFDDLIYSNKRRTRDQTEEESFDSSEEESSLKKCKLGNPATEDVSDFVKSRLKSLKGDSPALCKTTPKKRWWTPDEVYFQNLKIRMTS